MDHWVVEYWNEDRWVMLDAQIDPFQHARLGLQFDPAELPSGYFLTAGDAWLNVERASRMQTSLASSTCGANGSFRGNVACDLAGLNKVEMLPWDGWGTLAGRGETESDDGYVDDIVALMLPMISAQSADVTSPIQRCEFRAK